MSLRAKPYAAGSLAAAIVLALVLSGCATSSPNRHHTVPSVPDVTAGASRPTLIVWQVLRYRCHLDGSSRGLVINAEIRNAAGRTITAGAFSRVAAGPFGSEKRALTSADQRVRLYLLPLPNRTYTLNKGRIYMRFGVLTLAHRRIGTVVRVTVPSDSAKVCVTS
jgi:hypothetical protein